MCCSSKRASIGSLYMGKMKCDVNFLDGNRSVDLFCLIKSSTLIYCLWIGYLKTILVVI